MSTYIIQIYLQKVWLGSFVDAALVQKSMQANDAPTFSLILESVLQSLLIILLKIYATKDVILCTGAKDKLNERPRLQISKLYLII